MIDRLVVISMMLLAFAGCPRPVTPPSPPPIDASVPDCPAGTPKPTSEKVCGDQEQDGFRLVVCPVTNTCRFRDGEVYCVAACPSEAKQKAKK